MGSKRGRLALGIVLTTLATLVVVNGPNLWRWVRPVVFPPKVYGHPVRAYFNDKPLHPYENHITGPEGTSVIYFVETGKKWMEDEIKDGRSIRTTFWNFNGTVSRQYRDTVGVTVWNFDGTLQSQSHWYGQQGKRSLDHKKTFPPWWWDVQDQTLGFYSKKAPEKG